MPAIRETIGKTEILIQTVDVEVLGDQSGKYGTTTTSVSPEEIKDVYTRAKSVIKAIAEDVGTEMSKLGKDVKGPSTVDLEFHLGFSAKANAWFLSAGGEYALAVKMSWDLEGHHE